MAISPFCLLMVLRTSDKWLVVHGQAIGEDADLLSITACQTASRAGESDQTLKRIGTAYVRTVQMLETSFGTTQSTIQKMHGSVFLPDRPSLVRIEVYLEDKKLEEFSVFWEMSD